MLHQDDLEVIRKINGLFEPARSAEPDGIVAGLVAIGSEMSPTRGDSLISQHPSLLKLRDVAAPHYQNHIVMAEHAEAEALLAAEGDDEFAFTKRAGAFGQCAYGRVRDMFDCIDFSLCKRFVLVGCGALPVTMFHVHDRTAVPEIIGLDVDTQAISLLERVRKKFALTRIQAIVTKGEEFNFKGADVIYVANMVSPKKRVLERIIATAPEGVQIVLRDPYSVGRLLTELGTDQLDPKLEVIAQGNPEPAYLSRNVFLRING